MENLPTTKTVPSVLGLDHFSSWPREGLSYKKMALGFGLGFFLSSWPQRLFPQPHLWQKPLKTMQYIQISTP